MSPELAAVRWDKWKPRLNPGIELYDLERDPGETTAVRNGEIKCSESPIHYAKAVIHS